MIELLNNCTYALTHIKRLFIAARQLNGNPISFPLEYITLSGTSDSTIVVDEWNENAQLIKMGGQIIEYREIINSFDNIEFTEMYELSKQGKTYKKRISFYLPKVGYQTNSALKEFLFTDAGEFAISNAIAFVEDMNGQKWIVGYDLPLILQQKELEISEDNYYQLVFETISPSRVRNYYIHTKK